MSIDATSYDWEEAIGARVRDTMASVEMARYFNVKITAPRARVALLQLSLFVQCFATHAVADEKHGDLFLPFLSQYISNRPSALKAAEEALDLFKLYHSGVAEAMERLD